MRETSNYKLSQWDKTDRIQMEDFNADNSKVDAALAAQAAALTAGLATKGNCRIERYTYVGTGTYGKSAPNSMTFAERPLLMVLLSTTEHMIFHKDSADIMRNQGYNFYVNWSDNTFSWYSESDARQFNISGQTYIMIAFYSA